MNDAQFFDVAIQQVASAFVDSMLTGYVVIFDHVPRKGFGGFAKNESQKTGEERGILPAKGRDEIVKIDLREGFELIQFISLRWPTC